ncbi:Protein of unknown function [Anaerocolumna jejuensis DSM 15929]|uniref:DUF2992 family protein n=1 Tax=Anaerocolumna jejuensis DSM 15929 TaxID=1121322 RepID=A0A1M6ZL51_9FIRM|nr:YjdF family protein [Anaerocolumna jejuensis]SHL31238.1 Protein of unknown function [Anaerocolumna jejuensis DSM 15929]
MDRCEGIALPHSLIHGRTAGVPAECNGSKVLSKLTVLFEDPFWLGIYERETDGKYEVSRIIFGAEPKDYEVYAFLLKNHSDFRFSPSIEAKKQQEKQVNPKRLKRSINKQLQESGFSSKAKQALKLQQEQNKTVRKSHSRLQKEEEEKRQFLLHQQKRKNKHRGH